MPIFKFERSKQARRKLSLLTALLIMVGYLVAPLTVFAGEVASGGLTLPSTTQRQIIFDTTYDKYWIFYDSDDVTVYAYSDDSINWTQAGTLPYGYNDFHVYYQEIGGDGKIFFTTVCADFDICLRQGTTTATSIVFETERTVYNGSIFLGGYSHPVSRLDGSTVLYVAAFHQQVGGGQQAEVRSSTENGSGVINNWNGISEIGVPNSNLGQLALAGRGLTEMFVIIGNEGGAVTGYNSSNGAVWNPIGNTDTYSWKSFGTNGILADSGSGVSSSYVMNDKIYFGGYFFNVAEGIPADFIIEYDPATDLFERLSDPTTGDTAIWEEVQAIGGYDNDLYFGGFDMEINGVDANGMVKWDSETRTYSPLGPAPYGSGGICCGDRTFAVEEIGGKIYFGSNFDTAAGGVTSYGLVVYDPVTNTFAEPLGGGGGSGSTVFDIYEKSPTEVYIGGSFSSFGGVTAQNIVRYNPQTGVYTALGASVDDGVWGAVYDIEFIGDDLYFAGNFFDTYDASLELGYVAGYNSGTDTFTQLGAVNPGVSDAVNAIATDGTDLYLAGDFFADANSSQLNYLAKYDVSANTFEPLGDPTDELSGVNNFAETLAYYNEEIFVGGQFSQLGEFNIATPEEQTVVNAVAKYDPTANGFTAIGGHHSPLNLMSQVIDTDDYVYFATDSDNPTYTFKRQHKQTRQIDYSFYDFATFPVDSIFDMVGVGDNLYIAGSFTSIDGVTVNRVARYDESDDAWYALGVGTVGTNGTVSRLKLVGDDLYMIGSFTTAGTVTANDVARYDIVSNTWHDLGTGVGSSNSFSAIESVGTDIYLSCFLACTIDGGSFNFIAKYTKGTDSYSQLYPADNGTSAGIRVMEEIDGQLFIGGNFISAGGDTMNRLTRYDPVADTFNALGTGSNAQVFELEELDGRLMIGGSTHQINLVDGVSVYGTAIYDPDTLAVVPFTTAFPDINIDKDDLSNLWVDVYVAVEVDGNFYVSATTYLERSNVFFPVFEPGWPSPFSGVYSPALVTKTGRTPEITVSEKEEEYFVIDYWWPEDQCIKSSVYTYDTEVLSASSDAVCPGGETTTSWSCDQTDLINYYIYNNDVYSVTASYPFTSWSDPTLIYGEGVNYNISSSVGDDCPIVIWTNGSDPPVITSSSDDPPVTPPGGGGSTPPTTTSSGGSSGGGTTLPTGLPEAGASATAPYLPNWQWGFAVIGREINERSIRTRQCFI